MREVLGDKAVSSSSEEIVRLMRDESWLSPVLQREIERRTKEEGAGLGVQAVVRPTSEDDVIQLASPRATVSPSPRAAPARPTSACLHRRKAGSSSTFAVSLAIQSSAIARCAPRRARCRVKWKRRRAPRPGKCWCSQRPTRSLQSALALRRARRDRQQHAWRGVSSPSKRRRAR